MKFFIDTEFLEGTQHKTFLGVNITKTKPTIDLISIGIVAEDGREYYAISKDFNLKEAWNRYDIKVEQTYGDARNRFPEGIKTKVYWIRDNVLKPIYKELHHKENLTARQAMFRCNIYIAETDFKFTYKNFKKLINKYGKTNKQIAEEVKVFCTEDILSIEKAKYYEVQHKPCKFYGYYSDYDWVVFCWLFGRMIDLPKGFPMYCIDLKQELDKNLVMSEEVLDYCESCKESSGKYPSKHDLEYIFYDGNLRDHPNYPKQEDEHNALADSRFVRDLYYFLKSL